MGRGCAERGGTLSPSGAGGARGASLVWHILTAARRRRHKNACRPPSAGRRSRQPADLFARSAPDVAAGIRLEPTLIGESAPDRKQHGERWCGNTARPERRSPRRHRRPQQTGRRWRRHQIQEHRNTARLGETLTAPSPPAGADRQEMAPPPNTGTQKHGPARRDNHHAVIDGWSGQAGVAPPPNTGGGRPSLRPPLR